jgi:glycosyltransferase involved in cell wall biosynthesis
MTLHKESQVVVSKLSILLPVFNEQYFVEQIISQTLRVDLPPGIERELVIVDDGSTDETYRLLENIARENPETITLYRHETNLGKGAAVRTAIQHATGDIFIIQDADLEYDPKEYNKLLKPILDGDADVVYGSRFLTGDARRVLYFWHSLGNKFLTTIANIITNLNLTDMETCYKVVKGDILRSIPIRSNRFDLEPELTVKLAKRGCRFFEVPISYKGRTYDEGKKIRWHDGLRAVWVMIYFWLVDDLYNDLYGHSILHRLAQTHRFNRWMADTIREWIGDNVLEIGAGIGNLTAKVLPRYSYTASDIDPLHLEFLKTRFSQSNRVTVRELNIEDAAAIDALENRFDTVICLNVVEHVEHDEQALQNINRSLMPGGNAIILVPQGQWLYGSLDKALDHYRRYKRDDLIDKCKRAGFTIERVFSFNRVGVFPWFFNGRILRRRNFSKFQLKIYDSFVWLWKLIDRWLPWKGLSIIVIARKK